MTRTTRRLAEISAMALIGDGVVSVMDPRSHAELWRAGPRFWRAMVGPFARRPLLTGMAGFAMIAAGVLIAARLHRR